MTEVTISLAPSGAFVLGVPSPEVLHHIEVPANEAGIKMIRKILQARVRGEGRKISQPANPTQWQVEQWLKADREANRVAKLEAELQKEMAEDAKRKALFNGIAVEIDL